MNMVQQGLLILVGFSLVGSCVSMEDTKKRKLSLEKRHENKKSKNLTRDINARDKYGQTALIRACILNDITTVIELIEQNADVNIQNNENNTALMSAWNSKNTKIITLLLNSGADPNAVLIEACLAYTADTWLSNAGLVKLLLSKGANPNVKNGGGETALISICSDTATDIQKVKIVIKLLLDHGADPNMKDDDGFTALMWAYYTDRSEIVTLLLNKGGDSNIENGYGETALIHLCKQDKIADVILLVRHYWTLLTMNPEEKLTYVCRIDKNFSAQAETFVLSLKRDERETGLRVPKYLRFQMILEAWRQAHANDYRCALLFGTYEEKIEAFKAFLHAKNKKGETALMIAQDTEKTDIVTFLTELETALAQGKQAVREFTQLHAEKKDLN